MNSQTISLVRFPLAFAVVFIHCQGEVMRVTNWSEATVMDAYYTFKLIISSGIAQVAVPMFFFISGFLFFNWCRSYCGTCCVFHSRCWSCMAKV